MRLDKAKEHKPLRIINIHLSADKRKRLMHMGMHVGALLEVERQSMRKNPGLYLISGNWIMLRYDDAKYVEVEQV